jgi:hypothetical protein
VWLEALTPDEAASARSGVLCRRHADALVVPRGWWLDDRRQAAPRLFNPDAVGGAAASPPPARRGRVRRAADRTEELPLFPHAAEHDATVRELTPTPAGDPPDPDETKALPWSPRFDPADDLGGLLTARSPLLSRAFGAQPPAGDRRPRNRPGGGPSDPNP